jgi:hypothetical protein
VTRNPLGNSQEKLHSLTDTGSTAIRPSTGGIMIDSKVAIAGAALGVLAAFVVVSQPVQASSCALVSVKARGLGEAAASKRSQAKLTRYINHWAHKNKLRAVHVGRAPTSCSKGKALFVCTSSAKVCP